MNILTQTKDTHKNKVNVYDLNTHKNKVNVYNLNQLASLVSYITETEKKKRRRRKRPKPVW